MATETDSLDEFKKNLKRQEAARAKTKAIAALITTLISSMGVAVIGSQIFSFMIPATIKKNDNSTYIEISNLKKNLNEIEVKAAKYNDIFKLIEKNPSTYESTAFQTGISSELKALDSRLSKLESSILESPERALSIPLLRKDIIESNRRSDEYKTTIRSEIDRLYEQQKWILGGIGTVLLAIAGGAITILLRSLSKGKGIEGES